MHVESPEAVGLFEALYWTRALRRLKPDPGLRAQWTEE